MIYWISGIAQFIKEIDDTIDLKDYQKECINAIVVKKKNLMATLPTGNL